ncbi:MAG TPA: ABC transporter ATP-binding protein [Steroidobacteraceae bacterium]|jgi:oligopeptide/dipeptide ABC transporter ATP-binding protein|nr:ABC transporter ATP-binding protein [Steroidobacteraceae bacterium]
MSEALLVVEDLAVTYGATLAVESVSMELAPGRCLGIIGESGAGKTQAFLAMMGLLPTQARVSGRARLEGVDLFGHGAAALRGQRMAMIFQDPMTSLTPHMRIGDQIAEPLVTHRGMSWNDARIQAAVLLEQVRMNDVPRRLRQYPHELSGGMRQRVMIGMALACDPQLLIADEPTTALDVSVQAQILALLRQLVAERGMALAVVTHDMGVIAALADDVIVMRHGRIVERGPVARILAQPAHEYTRSLLAATPRVDTPGAGRVRNVDPGGAANPLRVHNLSVDHQLRGGWLRRAKDLRAVDGVSLELAAGEALGIVGESGCGKSTLSRALLRLGPVTGGEIVWLGRAIQDLDGEELRALRAGMQIVFQDPFASLDPTMSVADIVAEPLRALRPAMSVAQRAAAVAAMLEGVGLGAEFAQRRSRELSGGQCQRVAIARAMVLKPQLLVCDEAVSALDVSIQAQLLDLFEAIKREHGTSIVFVSHNLAVVRRLCERVLVMYLGRVVEEGPTEEVFLEPRHPYTRMLLESVPLLDPALERARLATLSARGETPSAVDRPSGCAFRTRCPAAQSTCAALRPEPEIVANSHQVACLRWRQIVNDSVNSA